MLLLDESDKAAIRSVIAGLETGWNKGSASAFVKDFAVDADFINVYGGYGSGREAIRKALDRLLASTYAGSRVRFNVETVRLLSHSVALAHVRAHLSVRSAPISGEMRALLNLVLQRGSDGWKIASYHNTLIEDSIRRNARLR
jgi:uncharacterized protein (TIGR02246 family)